MDNSKNLRRVLIFAIFATGFSGCISTPPKYPMQTDTWVLKRNWINVPVFANMALNGKAGQAYTVRGSDLTNLQSVVVDLIKQSQLDPQFALTSLIAPNAFASVENGRDTITLTLSLLNAIGSDKDALATTLGHELAHLRLKHGEKRAQRTESAKGFSNVLGTLLGVAGVPMGGTIASLGVGAVTTAYSRDEEREADILGLRWAMAAGYSACGSARTIKLLQTLSLDSTLPILASHPGNAERIERANQSALAATGQGC